MLSLLSLALLITIFALLAAKNWKTSIGAGPTILIVGAIVVSVFGAVKYSDYQSALREYDICADRVTRSQETGVFNRTLIEIIAREFPSRPDIADELYEVLLLPLELKTTCAPKPTFFESFR